MDTLKKFYMLSKKFWFTQVIGFILTIFYAIAYFASPYISKYMIDSVLPSKSYEMLLQGILIFLGVCILQPIVGYFKNTLFIRLSEKISHNLRTEIFESLMKTEYESLHDTQKGILISRILHDTENVGGFITSFFVSTLKNILIIVFIISAMLYLSLSITIVVILVCLVSTLAVKKLSNSTRDYATSTFDSRDEISVLTGQAFENIEVIKSYLMENAFMDLFKKKSEVYKDTSSKLGKSRQKHIVSVEAIVVICTMMIYGYGFFGVMSDFMSLGTVVALGLYFQMLVPAIVELTNSNVRLQQAIPSLERIEEMIELPKEKLGSCELKDFERIQLDDIGFSYSLDEQIISEFSMVAQKGEILGIKGENGSGKTTLVKMLVGLLSANSGQILLNNENINKFSSESIRSRITYVPQSAKLTNDTVMNNIKAYSDNITENRVIEISKEMGFFEDIEQLSQGFDTVVTENGNISGGQMRKVSLIRAFVRESSVYILDEPFAALDSESCESFSKYINRIKKNAIVILISHDPSLEKNCDKLINIYPTESSRLLVLGKNIHQSN